MLFIKDPIPSVVVDSAKGEVSRSYLYSPHLLYSPHILYPAGVLYGIYPLSEIENISVSIGNSQVITNNEILDILPKVDNIDIR
jgi:hypothetical protein